MRHSLLAGLLLIVGLCCLGPSAVAAEWVEGDGFRFRVPDGFSPADAGQIENGVMSFSMTDGQLIGGSGIDMEMRAYVRDQGSDMEASLGLVRMSLEGEAAEKLEGTFDLDQMVQMMEQGMDQAAAQYGAGVDIGETEKIMLGAGHAAVQWRISAEDPQKGPQVVYVAFTKFEESLYVLMLSGPDATARQDAAIWREFTTSVRLSSRGGILALAMKHWPFVAGGAVLLFGLFLLLKSSGRRRTVWREPTGISSSSGGFSRALDGLPTYDEAEAAGRGGGSRPGGHESSLPSMPSGGPRKIPVSRSPDADLAGTASPVGPAADALATSPLAPPSSPHAQSASGLPQAPSASGTPSREDAPTRPAAETVHEPSRLGSLGSLGDRASGGPAFRGASPLPRSTGPNGTPAGTLPGTPASGLPAVPEDVGPSTLPTNIAQRGRVVASESAARIPPRHPGESEDDGDSESGPRIQRNADFMK